MRCGIKLQEKRILSVAKKHDDDNVLQRLKSTVASDDYVPVILNII